MSAIEWRSDRRRLLIPVAILAPAPANDLTSVAARALVDTGSTTTGITKRIAEQLGLLGRGKRPLSSAQGEGQAERYLFRIGLMPIGEEGVPAFPYIFDEVIGFELTNSFQFDALLGMDILCQCDLELYRDGRCRLRFG
jgi:predicted aspartyl protease